MQYVGYVLSTDGVSASVDKVKAPKDYSTQRMLKMSEQFWASVPFIENWPQNLLKSQNLWQCWLGRTRNLHGVPVNRRPLRNWKNRLCTTPVLAYPIFQLPFILTTDASKVAVAAILSQVQDVAERVIAYASCQMNRPEQAYTTLEMEILSFFWAVNYFSCYLLGRKFLVRTDHSALSYLRKFADNNSRLMRWSLKLS